MPLAVVLSRVIPVYFRANPVSAEIALNMVTERDLSRALITRRNTRAASRLMGAYRFLGNEPRAQRIKHDMQGGVGRISPVNPFTTDQPLPGNLKRIESPQVARLKTLWTKITTRCTHALSTRRETGRHRTLYGQH